MHTRLTRSAPLVLAAALVAACGSAGGSGGLSTPGLGENTAPAVGASAPASMAPGASMNGEAISTFCQQWTTQVVAAWPPDTATAATLAPLFNEWAQSPEFATVGADLTTVGTWLATQGGSTTVTAPDTTTTDAYNRIAEFATSNCP